MGPVVNHPDLIIERKVDSKSSPIIGLKKGIPIDHAITMLKTAIDEVNQQLLSTTK